MTHTLLASETPTSVPESDQPVITITVQRRDAERMDMHLDGDTSPAMLRNLTVAIELTLTETIKNLPHAQAEDLIAAAEAAGDEEWTLTCRRRVNDGIASWNFDTDTDVFPKLMWTHMMLSEFHGRD